MLNLTVKQELAKQAQAIWTQYCVGNKSTARAMFNQVPDTRKAWMALIISYIADDFDAVRTFIESVTD